MTASVATTARNPANNATTTHTVTISSGVQAHDTIALLFVDRTGGAVINSITDDEGGTYTARGTVTVGTQVHAAYVREDIAAPSGGSLVITITTNASQASQMLAAVLRSDAGGTIYPTYSTAATPNLSASNVTLAQSGTLTAPGAGLLLGLLATGNAQTSTPTIGDDADLTGETVAPAGGSGVRCFAVHANSAAGGTRGFTTSGGADVDIASSNYGFFALYFVDSVAGDPAPTLTSVNGGTSVIMDGTAQPVVGADFDTVTFELEQDDGPIALDSANEDADSADIDVVSTVTPSPKFGNATLRAINADDQQDELAVTVDPPSGTDWVEIVSLNTGDIHLEYTPALTAGDQVWWRVTDTDYDETDVVIYDDGTFNLAVGLLPEFVEVNRRIAATGVWEGWEEIPISGSSEDDTTPDAFDFSDQAGVDLEEVCTSDPITVTGIDAVAAITVSGGEYNINGGSFTSSAGTVSAGDLVRARNTASDQYLTATHTDVTIGGVTGRFTSTTLGDPANAAFIYRPFSFNWWTQ